MNSILPCSKLIATPLHNYFFMRCYIVGITTFFILKNTRLAQLLHDFISHQGTGVLKMLNDVCHKTVLSHFKSYLVQSFPREQSKIIADRLRIAKDILRTHMLKQGIEQGAQ